MAKHTVAEIAEKLEVLPQYINIYKNRGKIIIVDGIFDDQNETNKYFLEKFKASKERKDSPIKEKEPKEIKRPIVDSKVFDQKSKIVEKSIEIIQEPVKPNRKVLKEYKEEQKQQQGQMSIAQKLDILKAQKLVEEIAIKKLQKEKLSGESIPAEYAENVFALHFKNVSTEFFNATDNYTSIVVEKLGGNRNDLSEFRSVLKAVINEAVNNAKKASKKDLENAKNKIEVEDE